jgi:hypothetical protein
VFCTSLCARTKHVTDGVGRDRSVYSDWPRADDWDLVPDMSWDFSVSMCLLALESRQPPTHRLLNLEVKHPKHEAYDSLLTSAEAKNA